MSAWEREVIWAVSEHVKKLRSKNLGDDVLEESARNADRLVSMILSSGLVSSLIFVFSRVRVSTLRRFLEELEKEGGNLKQFVEEGQDVARWLPVLSLVVDCVLTKELNLTHENRHDLLTILERLDGSDVMRLEDLVVFYLKVFSRIARAYGLGV